MLIDFFLTVRAAGVPAGVKEFLTLIEGLQKRVVHADVDAFYYFARTCLVKNEAHYDRFDLAFGKYMHGIEWTDEAIFKLIPEEWLRKLAERVLTDQEKQAVAALGSLDALIELLKKRLEEQRERHQGGSKWIGTAGTSPFGAYGYNPEGIRIGQDGNRNRRAVKVWDQREFRDYASDVEIGVRNMKVALRRLRRFARTGAADELDLDTTIHATAKNAGWLDIVMRPERHNAVKVLLFLDVGGSMDDHIELTEELFSAAKTEFKHLEHLYFHNCLYERVWKDNRRRQSEKLATWDILHKYASDYKVIFVGDATMSPYEIVEVNGSVEHNNTEPGAVWLKRIIDVYPKVAWLNPVPEEHWEWTASVKVVRSLLADRMYPLTLDGLERAMRALAK